MLKDCLILIRTVGQDRFFLLSVYHDARYECFYCTVLFVNLLAVTVKLVPPHQIVVFN